MTKQRQEVEQLRLARAVCAAPLKHEECTLLAGHQGPHISSGGRTWK